MRIVQILLVLTLLFPDLTTGATSVSHLNIMVIPKSARNNFWADIEKGANQAGSDLNAHIVYRGPYDEDQHNSQIAIIRLAIKRNFDAIVLAPSHRTKMIPAVKEAVDHGIKVVLIDSQMDGDYHTSFIGTDNYKAGGKAAEYLMALAGENAKLLLLRFASGNLSTDNREQGFEETVNSSKSGCQIIKGPYLGVSFGSAYRKSMVMFSDLPKIDGIFAPNGTTTAGLLFALDQKGLSGTIKVVGFDLNKRIEPGIIKGSLQGTFVQKPYEIGYLGVKTAVDAINNTPVPKKIYIETELIDRRSLYSE